MVYDKIYFFKCEMLDQKGGGGKRKQNVSRVFMGKQHSEIKSPLEYETRLVSNSLLSNSTKNLMSLSDADSSNFLNTSQARQPTNLNLTDMESNKKNNLLWKKTKIVKQTSSTSNIGKRASNVSTYSFNSKKMSPNLCDIEAELDNLSMYVFLFYIIITSV